MALPGDRGSSGREARAAHPANAGQVSPAGAAPRAPCTCARVPRAPGRAAAGSPGGTSSGRARPRCAGTAGARRGHGGAHAGPRTNSRPSCGAGPGRAGRDCTAPLPATGPAPPRPAQPSPTTTTAATYLAGGGGFTAVPSWQWHKVSSDGARHGAPPPQPEPRGCRGGPGARGSAACMGPACPTPAPRSRRAAVRLGASPRARNCFHCKQKRRHMTTEGGERGKTWAGPAATGEAAEGRAAGGGGGRWFLPAVGGDQAVPSCRALTHSSPCPASGSCRAGGAGRGRAGIRGRAGGAREVLMRKEPAAAALPLVRVCFPPPGQADPG